MTSPNMPTDSQQGPAANAFVAFLSFEGIPQIFKVAITFLQDLDANASEQYAASHYPGSSTEAEIDSPLPDNAAFDLPDINHGIRMSLSDCPLNSYSDMFHVKDSDFVADNEPSVDELSRDRYLPAQALGTQYESGAIGYSEDDDFMERQRTQEYPKMEAGFRQEHFIGASDFKCQFCDRNFSRRCDLLRHITFTMKKGYCTRDKGQIRRSKRMRFGGLGK